MQPTTPTPEVESTNVETAKVANNENIENNENEQIITHMNDNLNGNVDVEETQTFSDNIDKVETSANSAPVKDESVKTPSAESTTQYNVTKTQTDGVVQQPTQSVDNSNSETNSPQMVNNADTNSSETVNNDNVNSPQTVNNVGAFPVAHTTVNNVSQDSVTTQTIETENKAKPIPSSDEEFLHAIPPTVEETSIFEHQPEVNNDIFSTIVEVHPEIKTSPDFIDSQPAGSKISDPTENLEQSIRNSVKTEIELEQNLESSPVMEIFKDIAEPEIRQTLTEDLIEPLAMNQNDMAPKGEEYAAERVEAEKVETKEGKSKRP